jgi:hypothetical protein
MRGGGMEFSEELEKYADGGMTAGGTTSGKRNVSGCTKYAVRFEDLKLPHRKPECGKLVLSQAENLLIHIYVCKKMDGSYR